jgi:hypothetical protein
MNLGDGRQTFQIVQTIRHGPVHHPPDQKSILFGIIESRII